MHSLDFDESECNLICSSIEKLNESVIDTVDHCENKESELAQFALNYSDLIHDLYLEVNRRDSFTSSEIKMIYHALKRIPKPDKNVEYLLNSIADYCEDFKIELL
jgi:hypothetical protein